MVRDLNQNLIVYPVLLAEAGQAPGESDAAGSRGANLYSSILNIKAVHFLAVFALIYIGTEVTLGGWCIRAQGLRLVLTWLYQDGLLRL